MKSAELSEKVQQCNMLTSRRFGYLAKCAIIKRYDLDSNPSCEVVVHLVEDTTRPKDRLQIKFLDSVDIKIVNLNGALKLQLILYDISDRGLEIEKVKVLDEENGIVSLACRDFEFELSQN
jgi:hypothetical protein